MEGTHRRTEKARKTKGEIKEPQGQSLSISLCRDSRATRINTRLQLPSLFIFPLLISPCVHFAIISRGYMLPIPTLELKLSPPLSPLICSLHYSFITHPCSLCSASMSLFLFIPQLQAYVSNILSVRYPNFQNGARVVNHVKLG